MHFGYSVLRSAARRIGGLWPRLRHQMDLLHVTVSEAEEGFFLKPPDFLAKSRLG